MRKYRGMRGWRTSTRIRRQIRHARNKSPKEKELEKVKDDLEKLKKLTTILDKAHKDGKSSSELHEIFKNTITGIGLVNFFIKVWDWISKNFGEL